MTKGGGGTWSTPVKRCLRRVQRQREGVSENGQLLPIDESAGDNGCHDDDQRASPEAASPTIDTWRQLMRIGLGC